MQHTKRGTLRCPAGSVAFFLPQVQLVAVVSTMPRRYRETSLEHLKVTIRQDVLKLLMERAAEEP